MLFACSLMQRASLRALWTMRRAVATALCSRARVRSLMYASMADSIPGAVCVVVTRAFDGEVARSADDEG